MCARALGVLWVGVGVFLLAYGLVGELQRPSKTGRLLSVRGSTLWVALAIFVLLGLGGQALVASRIPFEVRQHLRGSSYGFALGPLMPIHYISSRFLVAASVIATVVLVSRERHPIWSVFGAYAVIVGQLLLSTWGAASRATTLAPIVVLFVFYVRSARPRAAVLCGTIVVTVLVILSAIKSNEEVASIQSLSFGKVTSNILVDNLSVIDTFGDPARWLWGRSLYGVLTMPIPRSIWPNKPYGLGIGAAVDQGTPEGTVSAAPTLPAELFANVGLLGVIVGMAGLCFVARRIDRLGRSTSGDPFREVWYGFSLFYLVMEIRGDFMSQTLDWLAIGMCLIATRAVVRWRGFRPRAR